MRKIRVASSCIPLVKQIRESGTAHLSDDILAGVITAILLIPQGMAYAMLAGLPPEMGLYASILPPIVYAFIGSSRALAVGPVAVAALMVANALSVHYGNESTEAAFTGAMILAAETGALLLLMGIFRVGALVSFISHPVLSGFTSGAAILIITSQLKHLSGINLERGDLFATIVSFSHRINELHVPTLLFGLISVTLLLLARKPLARLLVALGVAQKSAVIISRTAPLVTVIGATVIASASQAEGYGLSVVGAIPNGLPIPAFAFLSAEGWVDLLPSAILIALVGYVESVSVAKVLAARRRQKIDANRELAALGMSNIASAIGGAMPVAGGFSRSVVNFDAGARTQFAAIVTATLVAVVAVFFTDWFYYLPDAVLAAIIVVAVFQLIDISGAMSIWRYDRADGVALFATALAVPVLGIESGLLIGIGLSLVLYLWRTSQPHMAILGRMPGTDHFRNINRHQVDTLPTVLIVRVDENLYFANAGAVESYLMQKVATDDDLSDVVLLMSAVNYIDSSALEMLEHLEQDFLATGVSMHFAEVKGPVMDRLRHTHLGKSLADKRIHLSAKHAWEALDEEIREGSD
ncbi:MAG TPA: sulfate permease [Marinobacter sp.]|uniref:Sulfate permease n=2 Tax=root TaxID=1 RepID=A0A831QZI2_9GAMM|nr:sulfate permease [Marinobacter antarcticus]HDZ36870.1 sulfate permease [Marinobacter sp.]HEA51311.1 sulfate permease [Marinobacter antarcticus]